MIALPLFALIGAKVIAILQYLWLIARFIRKRFIDRRDRSSERNSLTLRSSWKVDSQFVLNVLSIHTVKGVPQEDPVLRDRPG